MAKSEKELGEATEMRQNAEAKLKAVTDRVAALEAALLEAQEKMQQLEDEVAKCTVQLSNADKLIGGLGGEAKSWEETVATLGVQLTALVGDVLVCAGGVSMGDRDLVRVGARVRARLKVRVWVKGWS